MPYFHFGILCFFISLHSAVIATPISFENDALILPAAPSFDDYSGRQRRQAPATTEEQKPATVAAPEITSVHISTNIQYRYATTIISNRVANPANESQEVSFGVTLPESAFISGFSMIIKDKVYEAYVKEKQEAKLDYEQAVQRGQAAGHLELSARDSNVFTMSVNVEPESKVTFNLTYEQLLTRTLGMYENIINVNPGQVVKKLHVEVNIKESANIVTVSVPDFKIGNEIDTNITENALAVIERSKPDEAKIVWDPSPEDQKKISEKGANGQFVVRYDIDRQANPTQILVDEGYFVHFYAPSDLKTLPKHVVFTLDISGSMGGRKIEQLREALVQILGDMSEADYFSLVLFSDEVELWSLDGVYGEASPHWFYSYGETTTTTTAKPRLVIDQKFVIAATPNNVARAKQFASSLNETGGTNIIAALRKAIEISQWGQMNNAKNAEPLIIFLTDGQPNVEMSDPEEIIKAVRKLNSDKFAIFSLAFGEGADYKFLRKLSLTNNGFARNIYVASDTSLQLKNFYKQVASPLLSNVTFQYLPGQVEENTTTKAIFSNFFSGSELVVAGKLSEGVQDLRGNLSGHAVEGDIIIPFPKTMICPPVWVWPPELIQVNKTFGHLEKLWAFLYIQQLLDQDAVSDEKNSTYKQKALDLSLKYSFVTPLTSLVVVKPNETESGDVTKASSGPEADRHASFALKSSPAFVGHLGAAGSSLLAAYSSPVAFSSMDLACSPASSCSKFQAPIFEEALPASPYLNISDILWLNETKEVKYPSSNNTYSIAAPDLPDVEFQICLLPNKTQAHCKHLAHCVLPEIINSFEDFIPYGEECVIDARFVGICCPDLPESTNTTVTTVPSPSTSDSSSTLSTPTAVPVVDDKETTVAPAA